MGSMSGRLQGADGLYWAMNIPAPELCNWPERTPVVSTVARLRHPPSLADTWKPLLPASGGTECHVGKWTREYQEHGERQLKCSH